jgi:hypothetical protein
MTSNSSPHHDAISIDGLAVLAVTLSGTDRTEESVFREKPHTFLFLLPILAFNLPDGR